MSGDDLLALALGLLAIAVFASWPVLPGLRRLAAFKTFPPFRAWTARPHPDAAVAVRAGARLDPAAGDRTGALVVVRTAWRNQESRDLHPSLRVSRPLAPVVSVDGVPASWGWGVTELALPPGEHLIAVSGSHSRCYRAVDLRAGERLDLDYASIVGATAHRHAVAGDEVRDLVSFTERRRGLGGAGRHLAVAGAGIVLLGATVAAAVTAPDADVVGTAAVAGAIGLGLGVGVWVVAASLVRQARLRRVAVAAPPAAHGPGALRVLDADEPQRLAPAPGWAGLSLHLRFAIEQYAPAALEALAGGPLRPMQRWRAIRIGEPEAPRCRPWVPAPEVRIDGRPVPAHWARMWTQLSPGEHELVVRVGAPPRQIGPETAVDLGGAEHRRRFRVAAGETVEVALCADVAAVPAPDRAQLAEYRVRLR